MLKSWILLVSLLSSLNGPTLRCAPAEEESAVSTAWRVVQHDSNPCDGVIG
jgi:hypothetical protein